MVSVLIIEDDELLRLHLRDGLAIAGHRVREAENGLVGFQLFQTGPADIVITDIVMDDGEGIEVIMKIRKLAPSVPVIAMSGSPQYLKNSSKLGAIGTILKPFRMAELLTLFESVLNEAA